jgi:hypothetical protein
VQKHTATKSKHAQAAGARRSCDPTHRGATLTTLVMACGIMIALAGNDI